MSSLCTHTFHRMDSKNPDIHVLDGWMPATETHPACIIHKDYLNGWIRKSSHMQKSAENGEPKRYRWGVQKKKKKISSSLWRSELCSSDLKKRFLENHLNTVQNFYDNNDDNNRIQRCNSRFLQSSHCAANCLQDVCSSGLGAIVCKSCASSAYHVQHVVLHATWYEGTTQVLTLNVLYHTTPYKLLPRTDGSMQHQLLWDILIEVRASLSYYVASEHRYLRNQNQLITPQP